MSSAVNHEIGGILSSGGELPLIEVVSRRRPAAIAGRSRLLAPVEARRGHAAPKVNWFNLTIILVSGAGMRKNTPLLLDVTAFTVVTWVIMCRELVHYGILA